MTLIANRFAHSAFYFCRWGRTHVFSGQRKGWVLWLAIGSVWYRSYCQSGHNTVLIRTRPSVPDVYTKHWQQLEKVCWWRKTRNGVKGGQATRGEFGVPSTKRHPSVVYNACHISQPPLLSTQPFAINDVYSPPSLLPNDHTPFICCMSLIIAQWNWPYCLCHHIHITVRATGRYWTMALKMTLWDIVHTRNQWRGTYIIWIINMASRWPKTFSSSLNTLCKKLLHNYELWF